MVYEKLSKNALRCMYAAGVVTGGILLAVIGAVDYFWVFPEDVVIGKWISLGAAILILFDACVSPWFRYNRYRYGIDEECIDIREGYLFIKRQIVPIERLHKLQIRTGPIDRAFHVAKVIVTTAGGDVTISFLERERAEEIAGSLRRRINEIAAQQKREQGEREDGRA